MEETKTTISAADECGWSDLERPVPVVFVRGVMGEVAEYLRTHPITPGAVIPVSDPSDYRRVTIKPYGHAITISQKLLDEDRKFWREAEIRANGEVR